MTRNDLIRHYGADPNKVDVVLLGTDEQLSPGPPQLPESFRERYRLPRGPFFLLVSKLSQRRDIPMLIEAMSKLDGHSLVVVGPDYLGLDVPALADRHGLAGHVHYLEHLPMDELTHLYRAADAFVLPTLHGGFSLTIVEAMKCGTPAIVFDHAALEGPVRDAAVLADPTAASLRDAMQRIADDRELWARHSARSLEAAEAYRWESTAERMMRILEEAAGLA